jgi:hypothetical protein
MSEEVPYRLIGWNVETGQKVLDWPTVGPAASGAAAVPVIRTAVYSPGLPGTKDANGS